MAARHRLRKPVRDGAQPEPSLGRRRAGRLVVLGTVSAVAAGLAVAMALPAQADTTISSSFSYTGAEQSWSVPTGVTRIHVVAIGAAGGQGGGDGDSGQPGGQETADITIPNGVTTLYVEVGQAGAEASNSSTFNGGGAGGENLGVAFGGGSGGGASDVRTCPSSNSSCTLGSRLVVGAGGGGGGGTCAAIGCTNPGEGGGNATGTSPGSGGNPAVPVAGLPGFPGSLGSGGTGGGITDPLAGLGAGSGGGGGGGWYGGGGGGAGSNLFPAPPFDEASGGDAGAGSSYAAPGATNTSTTNVSTAAGVTISYIEYTSTTTVTSSQNPSVFGHSVTYTATVTSNDPDSPTGTVTITDNGSQIGTGSLVSGAFSVTVLLESVGPHHIVASYAGEATNLPSSGHLDQTVNKAPTTTTLVASPTQAAVNQAVTLTATVGTEGVAVAPTGTVSFYLDGSSTPIATVPVSGGAAVFVTTFGGGAHSAVAVYSGDGNFLPSTSSPPASITVTCQHTLTGKISGLSATSGTTCLDDATVKGSVSVGPGATLDLENTTVKGAISAGSASQIRICGSTTQSVSVSQSTGFVLVGDPTNNCTVNKIVGNLVVAKDSGGVVVVDNKVTGSVISQGDSGVSPLGQPVTITGNHS